MDDFSLIVEEISIPDKYEEILLKETELIKQYDSVLTGYNVSIDGKPGWKEGIVCVNDGTYDLYIYPEDVDRFTSNGYNLGSCKHNFLRGFIWINNGKESKMIDSEDFELFQEDGYTKGTLSSPNKGKVWINNGINSKLVDKDKVGTSEFLDYKYFGRIEGPRKPRGSYDKSKKRRIVNDGKQELRVLEKDVDEFLNNNPTFKLGKLNKGNIILVNNPNTGISKFIDKTELDNYLSNGYVLGRKQ